MDQEAVNYTCGLPPDFPPSLGIPVAVNYVQGVIALVTGILGLTLNAFVLMIIMKYRSLHQRLMYVAVQIIVVEILYSLTVPPAIFVSSIAREWLLGDAMCNILGIVNDGFAYFRFMMTFILTLDRFVSVFHPFVYERNSKKILFSLLALVYITTFFRVFLPITGVLGCYVYVSTNKICTAYSDCSTGCYYFVLLSIICIVFFGVAIPVCMYMVLFFKAYRVRKKSRCALTTDEISIKSDEDRRQSVISVDTTVRPVSNDRSFQVTLTMFILLMSVIGCTSPAFVLYFVQFVTLHKNSTFFILIMLLGRTSFNSIPVVDAIAIMRDKQFKKSAKEFFSSLRK